MTTEDCLQVRASTRLLDREVTAARLLKTAAKHSYDPLREIDWDAPLEGDRYFHPPHRSTLYGTELWDRMDEAQRIELTKHEVASIACLGIWFETILMQMLIRHAYDRNPASGHVEFAYTEVADECRHSIMFAKMVQRFGVRGYRPHKLVHHGGRVFKATSNGVTTFAGAMFVEEILDVLQREHMNDESVEPLVRHVSRIHVIEEARHIRYAREESLRQWEKMGRINKAHSRIVLASIAYLSMKSLISPRVYADVGLDVGEAMRQAAENPHWQETKRFMSKPVVDFFLEHGMIAGPSKVLWRKAGLLPA